MPKKVLTIDDDPATTELLGLLLVSKGFDTLTANTGEDGVELVKQEKPDVIILDLMMPGMDGWKVCAAIRSFSQIPILVLSALDSPGMVASALDAGADDYLIKPVPSGVLTAHLINLMRRAHPNETGNISLSTTPVPIEA